MKYRELALLALIGTITISATTTRFVARDKFVVNTKDSAPVKISYITDNFNAWFLDKVEEPMPETTLTFHQLTKRSFDRSIIDELGGETKAETTLAMIYALMERQGGGKDGPLLTNGCANIFYVRSVKGELCVVFVNWYGVGWHVRANFVGNPYGWDDRDRVFARK